MQIQTPDLLEIHISCTIFAQEKSLGERATDVGWGGGCLEKWPPETEGTSVWPRWKDNRGVMRTVIDIGLVSRNITGEAGRIREKRKSFQTKSDAGKCRSYACSGLFPFASLSWCRQSNGFAAMLLLTTGFAGMTAPDDVAVSATWQELVKHEMLPHSPCTNKTWLQKKKREEGVPYNNSSSVFHFSVCDSENLSFAYLVWSQQLFPWGVDKRTGWVGWKRKRQNAEKAPVCQFRPWW